MNQWSYKRPFGIPFVLTSASFHFTITKYGCFCPLLLFGLKIYSPSNVFHSLLFGRNFVWKVSPLHPPPITGHPRSRPWWWWRLAIESPPWAVPLSLAAQAPTPPQQSIPSSSIQSSLPATYRPLSPSPRKYPQGPWVDPPPSVKGHIGSTYPTHGF